MELLEHLLSPWAKLYGDHTVVAMIVMTLHLLALLVGGGFALSADHATLHARARDHADRHYQLDRLARTHTIVIWALGVSFVSGLLLAAADVGVFLASPLFWMKLAIVALLLINGGVLRRIENAMRFGDATERRWNRLAMVSQFSIALWVAAVVVGVALTDFAG